ncbi:hypothetical protein OUZ56_010490 [Daphnia magna]|uniref:CCHC-type domain-containing protein n=1 Tax=Daphnia magna TaxID=35525 RepID=A0ABR0AIP7_9CRUS|nr:hypothetical protein OUZ56_010490 [Daphnia magna]
MNDDVVTGGHKLVQSPVNKHFQPEITVTLPDQETVARSLDFDNLTTETQFAPDTLQSGRTLETTAEAISRSASPVLNPKVHPKNSQLRKLRSNAAYKAVAGLDTTPSRKTRASATSEVASGKRSPSFFARFAVRISPSKSPAKVATKTSSLASTVLGFFHTKNTPNGKSLEPEPEPSIQHSQEQSRKDIQNQGEQAPVPNTCDQEPEGERSGFPVERSEGADPDNSSDTGHPTDEAISRRPEPIDGVEGTNDPTEVLNVDPRGETQCTIEEDDSNGTTDVRAESDFHVVCETVLDLPAGTVSQHNRLAERQGYLGINPELHREDQYRHLSQEVEDLSIHLQTVSLAYQQIFLADIRNLTLYIRELQLLTPLEPLTPEINLLLRKLDNFPGASRPNNVQLASRGDQTNALPNQNRIETTAITGYHGTDTTAIRGTTASTTAVENPSTTDTSATHRPPPYSSTTQPAYKSTQPFPGTTVQADSRRCCESRSPTSSVPAQSQTSQQGNLGFRLPVQNNNMAYNTSPTRAATVRDLDDFQNNQHTFSRLQLLPSFTGSPITRLDSWLESFESIVDGSGWSEEKTIQMLRAKLTDRAFSVIQAILKEHPHNYESIKEALLDHFHGDENVDLYLQKFNKAKRKPGEKVVDYALRIQEIFKRAYPVGHSEKSFAVILMQKFIEGLDSKLQTKIKYKEFKDFNELVAATRVYALRLEALETDREKQEFIRSIDGSQDTNSAELKEIKQMIIDQKEAVNKAVANIRHGDKPVEKKKTESEEIKDVLNELMQTVKKLQLNKNDVSYPANAAYRKQVSFQTPTVNQYSNGRPFPPRFPNNSGNRQFSNTQNRPTNATPPFPRSSDDTNNRPTQPSIICNFCCYRGHIQADCRRYQRQGLEQAQPPICYSCRDIGHTSNNCPKFRSTNRPNIPGSPQNQGNQ